MRQIELAASKSNLQVPLRSIHCSTKAGGGPRDPGYFRSPPDKLRAVDEEGEDSYEEGEEDEPGPKRGSGLGLNPDFPRGPGPHERRLGFDLRKRAKADDLPPKSDVKKPGLVSKERR